MGRRNRLNRRPDSGAAGAAVSLTGGITIAPSGGIVRRDYRTATFPPSRIRKPPLGGPPLIGFDQQEDVRRAFEVGVKHRSIFSLGGWRNLAVYGFGKSPPPGCFLEIRVGCDPRPKQATIRLRQQIRRPQLRVRNPPVRNRLRRSPSAAGPASFTEPRSNSAGFQASPGKRLKPLPHLPCPGAPGTLMSSRTVATAPPGTSQTSRPSLAQLGAMADERIFHVNARRPLYSTPVR